MREGTRGVDLSIFVSRCPQNLHANESLVQALAAYELNLDGLHAAGLTGGSRDLAVRNPVEPAVVFHVSPVLHAASGGGVLKPDFCRLHASGLTRRSRNLAVTAGSSPADVLEVGFVADLHLGRRIDELSPHGFHAATLPGGSRGGSVEDPRKPSISFDVGPILHGDWRLVAGAEESDLVVKIASTIRLAAIDASCEIRRAQEVFPGAPKRCSGGGSALHRGGLLAYTTL